MRCALRRSVPLPACVGALSRPFVAAARAGRPNRVTLTALERSTMERDIAMSASWAPQQYQLVLEFEGGETKAIELFGKNPLHGVSGVIARATGHTNVRIQCVNADGSALQDDVAEVAGLLGRRARVLFDGLEAVSINDGQVLDLAAPSATRSVARGYLYMAGGVAFVGSAIALWLARLG